MNRYLTFSLAISVTLNTLAIPSRAANRPHAGTDSQNPLVWTNDDLARLHSLGLISIVGQIDEEKAKSASLPVRYARTQDPEWYAEQAARLRDELEHRQAQLREYWQGRDDAGSLRPSTGGEELVCNEFGTTTQAGTEIVEHPVN